MFSDDSVPSGSLALPKISSGEKSTGEAGVSDTDSVIPNFDFLDFADFSEPTTSVNESYREPNTGMTETTNKKLLMPDEHSLDFLPLDPTQVHSEETFGGAMAFSVPAQITPVDVNPSSSEEDKITIALINKVIWEMFHKHTNEMLALTTGRKMIPSLNVRIWGLDMAKMYSIYLEFPIGHLCIWNLKTLAWDLNPFVKYNSRAPSVPHPDSPAPGWFWMSGQEGVQFDKVVLTNHPQFAAHSNVVCLKSWHAYHLRVNVVEVDESHQPIKESLVSSTFPETVFVAVPSYINEKITNLKNWYITQFNPSRRTRNNTPPCC